MLFRSTLGIFSTIIEMKAASSTKFGNRTDQLKNAAVSTFMLENPVSESVMDGATASQASGSRKLCFTPWYQNILEMHRVLALLTDTALLKAPRLKALLRRQLKI